MQRFVQTMCWALLLVLWLLRPTLAQTISGSSLSYRSTGSGAGNWTLSDNGYLGTYFTLASPGKVTMTVNASGATTDSVLPHMNLVIADAKAGFDVSSGFSNY